MSSANPDADDGDLTLDRCSSVHPEYLDLKGRPVNRSKTGTWKSAGLFYGLSMAEGQSSVGMYGNVITYLVASMHFSTSKAATQVTSLVGTALLLSVMGGFLADSYLGDFYTILVGGVITMAGLGLLIISVSILDPPQCPSLICKQASTRYVAPFFIALYTIAVGSGLVRSTLVSLGGDQFDDSVTTERQQKVHFFTWFYLFAHTLSIGIAVTMGVYLQDNISRGWGYGFCLMLYFTFFLIFLLGAPRIRHKRPVGSFLTRMAQVLVASLRKLRTPIPNDSKYLYSPSPTGKLYEKLSHTNTMRFFDRAAIIDEEDIGALAVDGGDHCPDPWKLCSVTQVEESKRLIQLIPIWLTTIVIFLSSAQWTTFTIQQAITMDRRLGPHFVLPPGSVAVVGVIFSLLMLPIYDIILIPLVRRYTGNPYGLTPLTRIGIAFVLEALSLAVAALVERKRLTYVRELHFEAFPLGSYALPMKFWWLLLQFGIYAVEQILFFVAAYEFYYHESASSTRSVASAFSFAAVSMGFFLSSVSVDITNSVTPNDKGGAWLKGQLNNGGLENFFWLLAVLTCVGFLAFLVCAYFYHYKYNWYQSEGSPQVRDVALAEEHKVAEVENAKETSAKICSDTVTVNHCRSGKNSPI